MSQNPDPNPFQRPTTPPNFYQNSNSSQNRFTPQFQQSSKQSKPYHLKPIFLKNKKNFNVEFRTQPIKKYYPRRKYSKADQPLSPMNTTQFILNSQGFDNEPSFENFSEMNNFENFGSMLGLVNEECFEPKNSEKQTNDQNNEIEVILKISRMESDPAILMDSIEKLAKIIKEKQEKIEQLEKSVLEEKQEERKNMF